MDCQDQNWHACFSLAKSWSRWKRFTRKSVRSYIFQVDQIPIGSIEAPLIWNQDAFPFCGNDGKYSSAKLLSGKCRKIQGDSAIKRCSFYVNHCDPASFSLITLGPAGKYETWQHRLYVTKYVTINGAFGKTTPCQGWKVSKLDCDAIRQSILQNGYSSS